jgi:hydroxymethylpyrimidine pyrophosphatase-like HAD family hydrolase
LYFFVLAADYDGTIAHDGSVDDATYDALRALKECGRKLLLVTGCQLEDLQKAFPRFELFDRIVAENGALIYDPASRRERLLASPPSPRFVESLKRKNVSPLSAGRCIVATWEPNENIVLETIRDLGLELQIAFNKGVVMVLPAGIDKATGFLAALKDLGLSPHNTVGVGDAENDTEFLKACGCSAAVANALPALKETVDLVLEGERGAGVIELAARICREDAALIPPRRHRPPGLGVSSQG